MLQNSYKWIKINQFKIKNNKNILAIIKKINCNRIMIVMWIRYRNNIHSKI